MNDEQDDEGTARIFGALCDPMCLRLLQHAVEVDEYDLQAACRLGTTDADTTAALDQLVDVGLLVRLHAGRPAEAYRIADAAAVQRLLTTIRQLGTEQRDA